jgi:hypothetical protein
MSNTYDYMLATGHMLHVDEKYNPMARNRRYHITCQCGYKAVTVHANKRTDLINAHTHKTRR